MIRRLPNKQRWYSIAPGPIDDEKLSWQARGLLVYLLSKPDDWVVSAAQLAHASPDSRNTVARIFKELHRHGYAMLEQRRDGTGHRATGKRWVVSEGQGLLIEEDSLTHRKPDSQNSDSQKSPYITYDLKKEPMIYKEEETTQELFAITGIEESPPIPLTAYSPGFIAFWKHYPVKVNKSDAWNQWRKNKLEPLTTRIMNDVTQRMASEPWQKRKYILNPNNYLRNRRWEDETNPSEAQVTNGNASGRKVSL